MSCGRVHLFQIHVIDNFQSGLECIHSTVLWNSLNSMKFIYFREIHTLIMPSKRRRKKRKENFNNSILKSSSENGPSSVAVPQKMSDFKFEIEFND